MPVQPGETAPAVSAPSSTSVSPEFITGDEYNAPMADSMFVTPDMSMPAYPDNMTWNAFSPQYPPDPFVAQPGPGAMPGYGPQPGFGGMQPSPYAPYSPYGGTQQSIPPQGLSTFGANGAKPYRYGWSNAVDVSWLPGGSATGAPAGITGDMDILGVDYRLGYTTPFIPGWILNWTNQFSYRNWNGPDAGLTLPSDLFRLGMDFEMETPQAGPWSISLGITPSLNTDFEASSSEGFQLDGRGILLMQLDQYWTLGLGAMYWDRVDDIVIPWAGFIYRDDYWEWRLMYPEAKVSLFLGNEAFWSKWLYVRGEYHVESYGVNRGFGGVTADDQVQIEDYRVLMGLNMDSGYYSWFFEGGYVFDRNVEFANAAVPSYGLQDGFIGQIGLRY